MSVLNVIESPVKHTFNNVKAKEYCMNKGGVLANTVQVKLIKEFLINKPAFAIVDTQNPIENYYPTNDKLLENPDGMISKTSAP